MRDGRVRIGNHHGLELLESLGGQVDIEAEMIGGEIEWNAAADGRAEIRENTAGVHLIELRLGKFENQRIVSVAAVVHVVGAQIVDRNIGRGVVAIIAEDEIRTGATIEKV